MFKFKFSYVALAAALSSSFVYADPIIYTHSSGAKIIDIEAPNSAGVSHNMYREFNVDSQGVVLNNSGSNLTHDRLGNIAKNNNLANGSASVILNEVTSNKSSALNGFIEVAGQKADVVIANPNGISCSGCSFINANKAVLTTGKVSLSDSGQIASYNVTGGKLTIDQNGLDATNSYAVLLADAITINGTVNAKNAMVGAGNFTFNNDTGAMTSAGKSATVMQMLFPEYSIDISHLGGIKANSITMVGNNLGFGVRNKGAIVANASLAMTSNGFLKNEGSITSNGFVTQIASAGNLDNTGTISTTNTTLVNSLATMSNEGTISSTRQLVANASEEFVNRGTMEGTTGLAVSSSGNVTTYYGSYLLSDGQLAVSALNNIDNGGSIRGNATSVSFGGNSFKVTGNLWGYSSLNVLSSQNTTIGSGTIFNSGRISGKDVTIQTNGTFNQEGNVITNGSLSIKSGSLNNSYYISSPELNIESSYVKNLATIDGNNVNINSSQGIHNEGEINAINDITLSAQNGSNITNYNKIQAGGVMTLNARQVINGGYRCGWFGIKNCGVGFIKADKFVLNSSHAYASNMGGNQQFKSAEINTISY